MIVDLMMIERKIEVIDMKEREVILVNILEEENIEIDKEGKIFIKKKVKYILIDMKMVIINMKDHLREMVN